MIDETNIEENTENPKRNFKGIWIPAEIWLDENISNNEKLFLVEINSLDGEKGCFASNNYFSKFFKLSKNRCSEIINLLEKKGYIKIKLEKKGKQITKRTIKGVFEKPNRGIRKIGIGYSENRKYNNTINNIDISKDISLSDIENKSNSSKKQNNKTDPKYKVYLNISKRLAKIISTHKEINCNSNISSWVNQIRLLMTKDLNVNGYSFQKIKQRVNAVLDFYEKNIGGEYISVVESGISFRKKFINLETAMKKQNGYVHNKKHSEYTALDETTKNSIKKRTIQI